MTRQVPLRKRLTAVKEALRAPLRPGGQSEQVLRTLERMRNAQRVAEEEDEKAYRFRLSPVAAGIALAVMAATVGWSYFMGYMVGLGQNPARQVARLTGAQPPPPPAQTVAQATLPPDIIKDDIPPEGTPPASAADAPRQDAAQAPAGKDTQQAAAKDAAQPAGKVADTGGSADKKKDKKAYPFARPSGQSLTAWGVAAPASGSPAQEKPASPAPDADKKTPPAAGQQLYDFVFQVAAFRKQDDADRLCRRLEEKGIRCRTQQSGKVSLVMAMLRGTALDGANLRAEFQRMGLGAPIQKSRKELKGRVRQ